MNLYYFGPFFWTAVFPQIFIRPFLSYQMTIFTNYAEWDAFMKYLPLNPAIFEKNRERFRTELLPGSIAIFGSNDEVPSNGDATYTFKQNSDLFWLSGIVQEDSMVIL